MAAGCSSPFDAGCRVERHPSKHRLGETCTRPSRGHKNGVLDPSAAVWVSRLRPTWPVFVNTTVLVGGGGESTCKRGSVRDRRVGPWMTIHLCGRPGSVCGRTALSLRDLAPGGVCRATPVARGAGALLPHRFTLTDLSRRSVLCGTFLRVTSTGMSQHPVLRSPDFPQPRRAAVTQSAPRHRPPVCHACRPSPPRPRRWWLREAD